MERRTERRTERRRFSRKKVGLAAISLSALLVTLLLLGGKGKQEEQKKQQKEVVSFDPPQRPEKQQKEVISFSSPQKPSVCSRETVRLYGEAICTPLLDEISSNLLQKLSQIIDKYKQLGTFDRRTAQSLNQVYEKIFSFNPKEWDSFPSFLYQETMHDGSQVVLGENGSFVIDPKSQGRHVRLTCKTKAVAELVSAKHCDMVRVKPEVDDVEATRQLLENAFGKHYSSFLSGLNGEILDHQLYEQFQAETAKVVCVARSEAKSILGSEDVAMLGFSSPEFKPNTKLRFNPVCDKEKVKMQEMAKMQKRAVAQDHRGIKEAYQRSLR